MINIDDSLNVLQLVPLDASVCNYYYSGGNIVVETLAQYLARVSINYRKAGNIVLILTPKTGYTSLGTYSLASWATAATNFDNKYYTFTSGLADINFVELVFYNTGTGVLSTNDFTNTYKAKLDASPYSYRITLPASSDVATRIAGAVAGTDYPTGWTLSALNTYDLLITHTLVGVKIVNVLIYEVDVSGDRLSKPFSDAYTGVLGNTNTILIEGLNNNALPLRIELLIN